MTDQNNRFSSRLTFLLSALGIAVGTGNIWRFPRIVASNAGEDGESSLSKKDSTQIKDCWEGFNRSAFSFNQGLDTLFINLFIL